MSDSVPGQCRSLDCYERADYFAEHRVKWRPGMGKRPKSDLWNGEFCALHLSRVLEMKVLELARGDLITIERLRWR